MTLNLRGPAMRNAAVEKAQNAFQTGHFKAGSHDKVSDEKHHLLPPRQWIVTDKVLACKPEIGT